MTAWTYARHSRAAEAPRPNQSKDTTMARHAKKTRAATLVAATALATVMSGGLAYGFWTTTGTGSGAATATTAASLTTGTATVTGTLYPGGSVSGSIVISNSNPFPVHITSAEFATAVVSAAGSGTCSTTGVTFAPVTAPTAQAPLTVGARSGSTAGTATLAYTASMNNTSDNGCQGASFSSGLQLQGQS